MAKKKILLLSDDIRVHSGVGTMSRALVTGTIHKYDWCQMAGAISHPEVGKVSDISDDLKKKTGIQDAYCRLYPVNGYGDQNILRQILSVEKPDAIMHFTDPRFWGWLYAMEHELRQTTPLMYYNIWDDLPFPHWNEPFYESCDALMAISKQTYNINKHVCQAKPRVEGVDLNYVPHGIDEKEFFPIPSGTQTAELNDVKKELLQNKEYDFTVFFNSRNIRRKGTSDLISAFATFTEKLADKGKKCCLILHTDPVDDNGTDLPAVARVIAPGRNIVFSNAKIPSNIMNCLYNIADVVCNPSSAEGFGLSHMEAMMSGTPTIATVVGGLQDQMGFKINGKEITVEDFSEEIPSNSTGKLSKEYGDWVYPMFPNMSLQGSPPTPYIYDSRPTIDDIIKGLEFWYNVEGEERKARGMKGRKWAIQNGFTQDAMCEGMVNSIDSCFSNFKRRKPYRLINTNLEKPTYPSGVLK